jgi:hypothetical protein
MKRRAQVAKHASVATKNVESQVLKTRKARLGATERAWEETIAQNPRWEEHGKKHCEKA